MTVQIQPMELRSLNQASYPDSTSAVLCKNPEQNFYVHFFGNFILLQAQTHCFLCYL